ncbi:MAG: hypothetical protein M1815_004544 [Lichina confinis]|nr:MAG: hypothetical protein M1815_004544 [Lichina confinis]
MGSVSPSDKVPPGGEYGSVRAEKFRFKSKRSRRDHVVDEDMGHIRKRHRSSGAADRSRRSSRHRHRHRHEEEPPKPSIDDPTLYDDAYLPNARSSAYMDPDTAFRESLFDALADDEGAAFWEGVYGQPIHTYSSTKAGPDGELERMTDEEYATHVRARMYEKTHQHIIEERERRQAERKRRERVRRDTEKLEEGRRDFYVEIEQSLQRGEQRKTRAKWKARWEDYLAAWDRVRGDSLHPPGSVEHDGFRRERQPADMARDEPPRRISKIMPWPVESGRIRDVDSEAVESFFQHISEATYTSPASAPSSARQDSSSTPSSNAAQVTAQDHFLNILKLERVRWHPDKVQQRLGLSRTRHERGRHDHGPNSEFDARDDNGSWSINQDKRHVEDDDDDHHRTMKAVTAVFQVIDRMWSERRTEK